MDYCPKPPIICALGNPIGLSMHDPSPRFLCNAQRVDKHGTIDDLHKYDRFQILARKV